jgi:DNA-binding PadR family transcriptional regulator
VYNHLVEGPVTTRAAVLQALRNGAGYGRELIVRVQQMTGGGLRLSEARVYPVLKALEKDGLVRAHKVTPGGRRGARSRTYYDLTLLGIAESGAEKGLLEALTAPRPSPEPAPPDRARMARRLLEMEEVSEFGEQVRSGVRVASKRP